MPPESHFPALEDLLARAWAAVYGDDPRLAAAPLRAALCLAPECGEAWAASADLPGAADPATLWGRAATCEPAERRFALAWGQALIAADPDAAAAVFTTLTAQRRDDAAALGGLGRALAAAGRPEALESLREAAALAPGDGDLIRDLAALYIECGDPLAAAEALAPFTGPACDDGAALCLLAQAWAGLGERDKALKALVRAEALGAAQAEGLRALLAAGDGDAAPPDAAYVRALFDRYAERFDKELVEKLDYRGPQLVAAAAARAAPGRQDLRVLDLGCGTGLAGETLRPLAAELHGVDLSSGMTAQARKRGLYDGLMVGGLVETLLDGPAAWDLLVAADVLMYLGDLEPAFAAAAAALRPGGALVFTVEAMTDDEIAEAGPLAPYLRPSRRYAHAPEYLRAALEAAGLTLLFIESAVLRMDRRQPVTGWVAAAARPAEADAAEADAAEADAGADAA